MAIIKMNKFSLIALNKDKAQILEELMKIGVTEITDVQEDISSEEFSQLVNKDGDKENVSRIESQIEKISSVLESLAKYDGRKKGLFEARRIIGRSEFNEILEQKAALMEIVQKVIGLNEKTAGLKSERNRNVNLIATLNPWKGLDLPLELDSTRKTSVVLGVVPAAVSTDGLKQELEENVKESLLDVIGSDSDQSYVQLVYHNAVEEDVLNILKKYGFSKVFFKDLTGTAKNNISKAEETIRGIDKQLEEAEAAIATYASEMGRLEVLHDGLLIEKDRLKALDSAVKTEKTFMIQGWIPKDIGTEVRNGVAGKWDCVFDVKEPAADEEYPILLANNDIGRSVESVTKMYSLPHYKELDPNSIMGPFFILFFGLMLSDGGYGLIMALAAGFLLWKVRLEESMQKFMKLMFYCGLSTIFWGALFGGWFGIGVLGEYPLWFNPVKDPEEMLKWSLLFGVIHIYVGLGVKAVNFIRAKKYVDAVLDVATWYVFFTGFVLFVLPYTPKVNANEVAGLVEIGKYLLLAGGVILILTQGRDQKNIIMKVVNGLSSLYNLIGFMSDVLSYSRLLALGLATSVIASIVNEMGAMGGLDNIFKIIAFIIVLLIGHTFNFAINALGAYVHSSRLQYIEFFGKFYKGGGTAFEPFKINTKYVILKN